jgi:hypothetical protein
MHVETVQVTAPPSPERARPTKSPPPHSTASRPGQNSCKLTGCPPVAPAKAPRGFAWHGTVDLRAPPPPPPPPPSISACEPRMTLVCSKQGRQRHPQPNAMIPLTSAGNGCLPGHGVVLPGSFRFSSPPRARCTAHRPPNDCPTRKTLRPAPAPAHAASTAAWCLYLGVFPRLYDTKSSRKG